MKTTFKRFLYVLLQCTWGLPQTLLGFFFFLATVRCPHRIYRGCIDTQWNLSDGLSLGLFIFTPKKEHRNSQALRVHEYGHTIQSLMLGPLYLIVIVAVSVVWANLPYFKRRRTEKLIPYTACFAEAWASRLGEKVTGERAI